MLCPLLHWAEPSLEFSVPLHGFIAEPPHGRELRGILEEPLLRGAAQRPRGGLGRSVSAGRGGRSGGPRALMGRMGDGRGG